MKITKQNLTNIIKEAMADDPDMGNWIARLTLGMNDLYSKYYELNADIDDLRVDLNNYIESGDKPKELQQQVIQPGDPSRTAGISDVTNPGGRAVSEVKMKLTKAQLVDIIKEQLNELEDSMVHRTEDDLFVLQPPNTDCRPVLDRQQIFRLVNDIKKAIQ
tara:strand:- start:4021 stop:4503 length:483 start_codon:yes stop_codon:yes gene_type:complete